MSRIGNNPINIADGVKVEFKDGVVNVKGPKGNLSKPYSQSIKPKMEEGRITFERDNEDKNTKALHGLTRSLVANMVTGV
ncbi:MAG: 50S ribosomal protein L6, partial [Candidatus Dadabacteria bacterium]|nr:50S ribosomal protein L6 [Candidatus Dadabacteria bacterium]NIS08362.1 50S ribosomal protein L6 [Candidatus Dadabacteria bacterium]NIV42223.1 50S ribosomal protein L6 [Candidatus Dadabacteria bacterium]NIX16400.1 50S ribosomal protein L6 [Candidatus Dadabacteria bacterium]NIY21879.1 50S ribosomal protein L6 [Candidatus Dadabacteria bacterium]